MKKSFLISINAIFLILIAIMSFISYGIIVNAQVQNFVASDFLGATLGQGWVGSSGSESKNGIIYKYVVSSNQSPYADFVFGNLAPGLWGTYDLTFSIQLDIYNLDTNLTALVFNDKQCTSVLVPAPPGGDISSSRVDYTCLNVNVGDYVSIRVNYGWKSGASSSSYRYRITNLTFNRSTASQLYDSLNDETINPDGTCKGLICNIKKVLKGIWDLPATIWNFIKTGFEWILDGLVSLGTLIADALIALGNFIIDGIKALFIPSQEDLTGFFDNLSSLLDEQFGFLAFPFTLTIDFINRFLSLSTATNFIINVPSFTLPFFNVPIFTASSYNLADSLTYGAVGTIWNIYLDFIDVFVILNFVAFCHNKYQKMTGGDVTNFEYYTTQDEYYADSDSGEVAGTYKHIEKKTRRKAVS